MLRKFTRIQKVLNLKVKGKTMKSNLILLTVFLFIFILFTIPNQARNNPYDLRDGIIQILEQQAKSTFGNDYLVSNYVIMDSVINRGPLDVEMEDILDPYNTLAGIIIFSTYTEENPEEQYFCLFKNNSIIWYYEDKIEYWWGGQIFTTNDINSDGKVEIVTIWGSSLEYVRGEDNETITFDYMYIFGWDGINGNLLNEPAFQSSDNMFEMFDLEVDGIYEFRAYWKPIWGDYPADFTPTELPWVTFGWTGSQYTYSQEIQTPGHQYLPTDGVIVDVSCEISKTEQEFEYNYTIHNSNESKQRINAFYLKDALGVSDYKSPSNWKAQVSGSTNGISWYVFPNKKPSMIYPGENKSGFGYLTAGLPIINYYYILGYQPGPHLHGDYTPPFSIEDFRNNKLNNSVNGLTVSPADPPDSLVASTFIDTLLSYTSQSLALGWIANQATTDKYDSLFTTAKTLLQQNHIPYVESTLHTVLAEVDEDSSGNITSEAYALLRYNTEYLLENLPEIIPPVLNSISPAIYLRPISSGLAPSALTVTATGEFFSDSSVAYYNGIAKATTYVSDTVLTFQLSGSEVNTLGSYPVWISNYSSNSDTLTFSVTDNLPQSITPTLQCVRNNGGGSYTAYFGYNNNNNVGVFIPIGSKNKFSPNPIDRGQTKLFLPGSHTNVFSVNFDGKNLTWTLDQASVTANRGSTPCP